MVIPLIGVVDIRKRKLEKRDFLLFDALAITGKDKLRDRRTQETAEWLIEHKLIHDLSEINPFEFQDLQSDPVVQSAMVSTFTSNMLEGVIPAFLDSLKGYVDRKYELNVQELPTPENIKSALETAGDLSSVAQTRVLAYIMEVQSKGRARATALLPEATSPDVSALDPATLRICRIFESIIRNGFAGDLSGSLSGKKADWLEACARIRRGCESRTEAHKDSRAYSKAAEVVIESLPMLDDSVPWAEVLEFRNTDEMRSCRMALRTWISSLSREGYTAVEIREELDHLVHEYSTFMRHAKIKATMGSVTTLISMPFDIIAKLLTGQFAEIGKGLFTLKERHLQLLQEEQQAPGKEIAYIVKARQHFR